MHQKTKKKQIYIAFFIYMIIIFLVVSSCQLPTAEDITGITPTPVTPSPTLRVCPETNLDTLESIGVTKTFIIVLFDVDAISDLPLDMMNGKETYDVVVFIEDVLSQVLGPGDQYSLFSLGFRGYDAAKFDRYASRITDAPELMATPEPPLAMTAIASPTKSNVVLENQVASNKHNAAVIAQNATATQVAFEYNCDTSVYEGMYQATATYWNVTKQAESREIATQVAIASTQKAEDLKYIETPFASNNLYEGLAHASVDFQSQCQNYENCFLIIVDEMIDWRNTTLENDTPKRININLSGVEVIAVLPQYADMISPNSINMQASWAAEFKSFGVIRDVIYINGQNAEKYLIDYLGDK